MRKIIFGFILGAMVFGFVAYAGQVITKFDDRNLPVLNTRLDRIEADIRNHEASIVDHEARIIVLEP